MNYSPELLQAIYRALPRNSKNHRSVKSLLDLFLHGQEELGEQSLSLKRVISSVLFKNFEATQKALIQQLQKKLHEQEKKQREKDMATLEKKLLQLEKSNDDCRIHTNLPHETQKTKRVYRSELHAYLQEHFKSSLLSRMKIISKLQKLQNLIPARNERCEYKFVFMITAEGQLRLDVTTLLPQNEFGKTYKYYLTQDKAEIITFLKRYGAGTIKQSLLSGFVAYDVGQSYKEEEDDGYDNGDDGESIQPDFTPPTKPVAPLPTRGVRLKQKRLPPTFTHIGSQEEKEVALYETPSEDRTTKERRY